MNYDYEKTVQNSNFQLLTKLLETFHPARPGVASSKEVKQIMDALCIDERDLMSLQNLRDFTVLLLSDKSETAQRNGEISHAFELMDISSAITAVIDQKKFLLGGEV